MNYNYIINPETGIKVNIMSKLGNKIIKNYVNILIGRGQEITECMLLPLGCY